MKLNKPILLLVGLGAGLISGARAENPNIVIIYVDDLGYGDLGCFGATKVKTPNLDKLATQGKIFTDMHSASAVSSPSRYSLLTGEYAYRKRLMGPLGYKTKCFITKDQLTLGGVLQKSGYKTAIVGKWHLGFGEKKGIDWNKGLKPGPLECGFDYFYGLPIVSSDPPFVLVENHDVIGYDPKDPFIEGVAPATKKFPAKYTGKGRLGGAVSAHKLYDDEMLGTQFTEKSVEWIKKNKNNPFFLYLATNHIHHPFTPHPRFKGTSEAGIYGDFIHELDWMVGEVLNTLEEEEGLTDNTLVIFTSDNGAMLNEGGQKAMNAGHKINGDLFGFKFDAWEGGHRVPMIVRWPKHIKASSKSDQLISNVDMVSTIAALVDYPVPEGQAIDSYNMLPVLLGKTKKELRDHHIAASVKYSHMAYREGDWVYISGQGGGGFASNKAMSHGFGGAAAASLYNKENSDIENGEFKEDAPEEQLYNLKKDPHQKVNLAKKLPEKTKQMRENFIKRRDSKATRY